MQKQDKLMDFINRSDKNLREFLEQNPKASKFRRLEFNDSVVQERMMRLGIEARYFGVQSESNLFSLAIATLQNDHVENEKKKLGLYNGKFKITVINDNSFTYQLNTNN